jgi:aspartate carbamoyltransferase catalytic subunit
MPIRSFLDTRPSSSQDILSLFHRASELEKMATTHGNFYDSSKPHHPKVVFCLFLEPSTRTRLSFEMAAYRLGHHVAVLDAGSGSSRVKGESDVDTVSNILAMKPDVLVIRYNRSPELDELLPTLKIPIISGGNATAAHPTQALLDAYTIFRERGHKDSLRGERVLIVGDILHSRVARSNFDVLSKLGAEIAVCGPAGWLPEKDDLPGVKIFDNLDEAVAWPTVYMGLRVQLERHGGGEHDAEYDASSLKRFNEQFGLNPLRLKKLSKDAMIMHPGPINHGVEFTAEVTKDSRSKILKQVTNGVLIRAALLSTILDTKVE